MSVERVKGEVVFTCDECDETLETDTSDFEDARADLRGQGWRTAKDGEAWRHFCPACRTDTRWAAQ